MESLSIVEVNSNLGIFYGASSGSRINLAYPSDVPLLHGYNGIRMVL